MHSLRQRLASVVESFWFVPAVLLAVAAVLAEVLVGLDRDLVGRGVAGLPLVNNVGASGSRDLLAAIGGSMLGVAATSFSITISVIATASSTYGPRLVRNFMADRGNQLVLGTFGATFLYALLVLRSVREQSSAGPEFVPHLAVTLAIGLAVLDVAVLIYFIHHIAESIQIANLAARVLQDLQSSLRFDDHRDLAVPGNVVLDPTGESRADLVLRAEDHGFLRHVDYRGLVETTAELHGWARLLIRVGDHVVAGDPLIEFRSVGELPQRVEQRLRRHLDFGRSRTPHQDQRYAVQQLAEMAVRALSSGTNDPYTAINAILEIGTGLTMISELGDPPGQLGRDGEVRLLVRPVGVAELVDLAFDQIRTYAVSSTGVVLALLDLRMRIGRVSDDPAVQTALRDQESALVRQFHAAGPDDRDIARVEAARSSADRR